MLENLLASCVNVESNNVSRADFKSLLDLNELSIKLSKKKQNGGGAGGGAGGAQVPGNASSSATATGMHSSVLTPREGVPENVDFRNVSSNLNGSLAFVQ
jgi:hypothetical protein